MIIQEITAETFGKEVESFNGTVLMDFVADNDIGCCSFCISQEDLNDISVSLFKVCRINVKKEKTLANRFGIMAVPTLIVFKNGEIMNRSIGSIGNNAIRDMLGIDEN